MNFGSFLGNPLLKERLSAAAAGGTLSHCYLLSGPRGSGKHTLSRLLAAAMQCESAAPPCLGCNVCRKVMADTHPDVITVDDPGKKTVPVDLIRETISDAYIRPNEGRRKIYLFPRAQDLGLPAQNALLKLLEEPPAYASFLLLTENPDQLLVTVRSRCVELELSPLPQALLQQELSRRHPEAPAESCRAAVIGSGGFLGQALELLEGEAIAPQSAQFAAAFGARDRLALLQLLSGMEKLRRDQFLPLLIQWQTLLVDALKLRAGLPAASQEAAQLARRTNAELAAARAAVQTAMEYTNANVGVAHLCGMLAAQL